MNRSLRALAALLAYPEDALREALPEIRSCAPDHVQPLLADLGGLTLYESQERYVALFDRSRALSLHLFEHVHGESRERGQAMVDLGAMYAARGFAVAGRELPDFIPAYLEYLSLLDGEEAKAQLGETAHIFRALGERLAQRGSPYAAVFAALLELAGEPGLSKRQAKASPEENLDGQWMDPQVTFGGPAVAGAPAVAPVQFYRKGVAA